MNNNYNNPIYPTKDINNINFSNNIRNELFEEEYIDTIIKKNIGKNAKFYITIPTSTNWQDKIFEGIIENVGKDHVLLLNPNTNEKYIIPLIYTAFITYK